MEVVREIPNPKLDTSRTMLVYHACYYLKSSNIIGDEAGCLHFDLPSFGDIVTLMVEESKCLSVNLAVKPQRLFRVFLILI